MRVYSTRQPGFFWVDWWLMNHCSWHCSYCAPVIRNGTAPWPSLRDCQIFQQQLVDRSQSMALSTRISYTGGEATEWTALEDLLEHGKSLGIYQRLRTNANVDNQRWIDIVDRADHVTMLWHPEHTATGHFLTNLKRALAHCGVDCVFNLTPERFNEADETINLIQSKWPNVRIERKMLFNDPAINTKPKDYSEQQITVLKRQHGDMIIESEQDKEYTDYQTMLLESKNRFKDWQCYAGLEQIIVDAWGRVSRGHCRMGGHIGNIKDGIRWPSDPIVCQKDHCSNHFDLQSTKITS